MPQTFNLVDQSVFTVPEEIAELEIKMWGAGGGGEQVADDLTKTAGEDGGDSEFFGLKATGGAGGSSPGGGTGGEGSSVFDWASVGVSVGTFSGNNGSIPDKGNGALIGNTRYGNGGGGDPGNLTYQSSVTHFFNNDSNTHTFYQTSPDLSVTFVGQYAPDGLSCAPNYGTKHYLISFYQPFTNANYNLVINSVTQAAAGGGSNTPYFNCGILGKTSSGFRIWFGNGNSKNTYVMGFVFTCTGLKAGGQGMGGGGGGAVTAAFTRQDLIDSITYAPGTTHTATVGSVGVGYNNEGANGYLEVSMIIRPKVIVDVIDTVLIIGQCTTLSWETTGDADTLIWLSGNIANSLLTSSVQICPQITTTYTAQASGIGGTSAPSGVTVYVVYVPTATLTVPDPIDYGDALFVNFETQYADLEIRLEPFHRMTDGTTVIGDIIQITPAITGESGRPDSETVVNSPTGGVEIPVPWGTVGPQSIDVKITVVGTGGSYTESKTLQVNIDRTPDNVIIPETDDAFKDQDPIYTPDTDILTNLILIDGIDIPVTVKSNREIKIDINQGDNWTDVEQL
jgi:hypothetical protein